MEKGLRRTIIWSSVAGGVITAGYFLYRSILKAVEFTIQPSRFKLEKADLNDIQFKIVANIKNPSDLKLTLSEQEYDIHLNGVYITTLKFMQPQVVYPQAISAIQLDVDIKTQELKQKLQQLSGSSISQSLNILTNLKDQRLKMVAKLKVKYGILPRIPIEITYEDTLKGWGLV